jgi:hypothetical protein
LHWVLFFIAAQFVREYERVSAASEPAQTRILDPQ